MTTGFFRQWTRWLVPFATFLLVFQLTGCGDKEAEQRKAFVDFLQNTAMRSSGRLPTLSEDQKQKFGPLVSDYAILYGFSQQLNRTLDTGVKPVVETLSAIRTPQDYLTQRDTLHQVSGALTLATQQMQTAKMQAETSKAGLKQPDDLKAVYETVYNKVVLQPSTTFMPLLPALQTLCQNAVQAGDFLQQQGSQVTFNGMNIQFPTQQQAAQYNALMASLSASSQALNQAQSLLQQGL
ncbi:MAG: hypothetical protein XXXJIFNMEKO3_03243 [Candidatus Erwinia impunctatus]|nr:hypothetical protein XXXJIFNMEKO_03243 [Culicoides impunctatus]